MGSTPVQHSVLNVKVFGAFSVIVTNGCETDRSFYSTSVEEIAVWIAVTGDKEGDSRADQPDGR